MKTSDLGAYQHIEQITTGFSSTSPLNFRALLINPTGANATATISGTTWEKDTSGNWKTFTSIILRSTTGDTFIVPLSVRTLTTVTLSTCTMYGLR